MTTNSATTASARTSPAFAGGHVFVLAGMHRSGTSMAASILQAGGVNVGERLMGADRGNPRGHFENMDFFEFHRDVLKRQGHSAAGWVHGDLPAVPGEMLERARKLVADNAAHAGPAGWGWKDPRSTLFLEYWREIVPGAHFVFIYRSPWEVADSVFRRGTDQDQFFRNDPSDVIRVWAHYNRLSLAFMRRHPGQCVLVSNDAVVADPAGFVRLLNERFGAGLTAPAAAIVDREIMHTGVSASTRPQLVLQSFPETLTLLEELDGVCAMRSTVLTPAALRDLAGVRNFKDSFKDWFEQNQLRRDVAAAEARAQADLAWFREKVAALEVAIKEQERMAVEHHASLTRQHELLTQQGQTVAQQHDLLTKQNAALAQHHELMTLRQKEFEAKCKELDEVRWEWLKASARIAQQEAEHRAALAAMGALRAQGAGGPVPGPWEREGAIEIPVNPPNAADVAAEREVLVMGGPFGPGRVEVAVQVAVGPGAVGAPESAAIRFSGFPGAHLWVEIRVPVALTRTEQGLTGMVTLELQGVAACCGLVLPSRFSAAQVVGFTITTPR